MKIILLFIGIILFQGCSVIPPTKKEFENNLKSLIGTKERGFQGQKIIIIDNNKEWYYIDKNTKCEYIIISDLNDIIIGHKIITPNICKSGYPAVW